MLHDGEVERKSDQQHQRDEAEDEALPKHERRPRALLRLARGQAFDRMQHEGRGKVAADGAPHRLRRGKREFMRRQPRQHLAQRVGSDAVGRQDEAPCAGAFLQQPDGKALARVCRRGGCDVGGEKIGFERRAAGLRQCAVIIRRVEPAMGDQHLVRMHARRRGNRFGARQGGGIDEAAEQESVFGARQCLEARSKMRVLPARPERFRHSRHGNAPSILPRVFAILR